ncbi:MAG: hypothetical protein ACRDLZ_02990, partial [Gaiellaceae bacterium]
YDEYAATIARVRAEAAATIAADLRWDELHAFARSLKVVWFFGAALADAGRHEYDAALLALLESDDTEDVNLSLSYFGQRFRDEGWPWLEALLDADVSARQRARLLLATGEYPTAWEHLTDEEVTRQFWLEFRVHGLGGDFSYVTAVVDGLYAVDRYGAGLDLLNLYLRNETGREWADLIATGLEQLVARGNSAEVQLLSQYGLRNLFSYLERVALDESRLARLEWAYLPAFEFEPAPPTLSHALATDPAFFVEAITLVFRPGDEDESEDENGGGDEQPEEEPGEPALTIARNAYRLLSEWRTLPGRQEDGSIDGAALRAWVEEARTHLREAGRLRIGDTFIGKLLAASPPDPDGSWPCRAVRDLLEAVRSSQIEDGMRTEIFNSLGVSSRGVLDGGDQERDKSAIYREQAQRLVDRWPQTAAVLRDSAETFERLARDYDDDAERRRTGFDT